VNFFRKKSFSLATPAAPAPPRTSSTSTSTSPVRRRRSTSSSLSGSLSESSERSERSESSATSSDNENDNSDNDDNVNDAHNALHGGDDEAEPVFQSQAFALAEFERAFVAERAALGLAPKRVSSSSGSSSRRRHAGESRSGLSGRRRSSGSSPSSLPSSSSSSSSAAPASSSRRRSSSSRSSQASSSSSSSVLLSPGGVELLDRLLESVVTMQSGRWDCLELISAPQFGEVLRVEDQGILLIAPTRTHLHVPRRASAAKLCVLNHLFETLHYPLSASFDATKRTILLTFTDNGVTVDLRKPAIVPTPLYLRSERAERGIITAQPGEIVITKPVAAPAVAGKVRSAPAAGAGHAAASSLTSNSAGAAVKSIPSLAGQRKKEFSRVQWRLSRNMAQEFSPDEPQ
jgi:hypothetical protein